MAPSKNHRPFARLLASALLVCALGWTASPCAAAPARKVYAPPTEKTDSPPSQKPSSVLIPWLDLSSADPLQMRFNHELTYNPATRSLNVQRSYWQIQRLQFRAFGGDFHLSGIGRISADGPDDIATTFTLKRVDLVSLMRQLHLPRAGEIEAKINGLLAVAIHQGEWTDVRVNLSGAPGTVRISRRLLKELLVDYLQGSITEEQLESTLGAFFGDNPMIPLEEMTLEGSLGRQSLEIKIPLKNEALDILIEPRIERNLLWEIWNYVAKNLGLDRIAGVSTVETNPNGSE